MSFFIIILLSTNYCNAQALEEKTGDILFLSVNPMKQWIDPANMCYVPEISYSSEPQSLTVQKLISEHTSGDHAALADTSLHYHKHEHCSSSAVCCCQCSQGHQMCVNPLLKIVPNRCTFAVIKTMAPCCFRELLGL